MVARLELRPLPELKEIIAEASRALALLDAERLEQLARACESLNRADRGQLALQARQAAGEMAVFGRVLEATRANLAVMNRLRDLRQGRSEYDAGPDSRLICR